MQYCLNSLDVEDVIAQLLVTEGYVSVDSIASETSENLEKIEGFDDDLANEIVLRAQKCIKEQDEEDLKIVDEKISDENLRKIKRHDNKYACILANENILNLNDFADLASYELIDKEEGIFRKLELDEEMVNQHDYGSKRKNFFLNF